MMRLTTAALALLAMGSVAHAADQMPINFVGEWCAAPGMNEPADKNTSWYQLPSVAEDEDGHCTGILSIGAYGFGISGKWDCDPVSIRLSHDTAPSGITYWADITARCVPEGVESPSPKLRSFRLYRYKGSLSLTSK